MTNYVIEFDEKARLEKIEELKGPHVNFIFDFFFLKKKNKNKKQKNSKVCNKTRKNCRFYDIWNIVKSNLASYIRK